MRQILLPVDFSYHARNAVDYAIRMFGLDNAAYLLLNSYIEPPTGEGMLVSISDILHKSSQEGLAAEYEYILRTYPHDRPLIERRSEYGHLPGVINQVLNEQPVDLIVMGTAGASGLGKIFFGSNTASVVKRVKCPLLVVPEGARYEPPRQIVLATDVRGLPEGKVLEPLLEMARTYEAEVVALHIETEDEKKRMPTVEEVQEELSRMMAGVKHTYEIQKGDNVMQGLNNFVRENGSDMLVVLARHYGFWQQLFHQSVAGQMSMLADVPLLVLHERK